MKLLDTIATRLGYTKTATIDNAPQWLQDTGEAWRWGLPTLDMAEAQLELYKRLSWVSVAVNAVARTAALAALSVKSLDGEETNDIPNHPFEMLLRRPNPLQSRFELLEATFANKALTGNGYWWLNRTSENQPPSEIWVLQSNYVEPVPDGKMFLKGYVYKPGNGAEIPLEPWEVCHFKNFHPLNPYLGLSPIESLAIVATGDIAMQQWNTNFFSKDNAKLPGALAFADPIDDTRWAKMKADINREHGGSKRSLMMLRNVGTGGVQWVNMAMSQTDMDFLNARQSNKEEIFAAIAGPGLASIMAINATEANSIAGRRTFIEMGVWPQMVAVAEKITNDVLPAYGPNLSCEFDDIRPTDRVLELQEQAAFANVATVDEVRKRYYELDPIGDERGALLVAQIGQGAAPQDAVTEEAEDENIPVSGMQTEEETDDTETETPGENDTPGQADMDRDAEIAKFRRWASKRRNPDPDKFQSDILTSADKAAILGNTETVKADVYTDNEKDALLVAAARILSRGE